MVEEIRSMVEEARYREEGIPYRQRSSMCGICVTVCENSVILSQTP